MPIHPDQINLEELKIKSVFNCPSGVQVGDPVYQSGINTVDKADCSDSGKMPCVGIVDSKPTSTTCSVVSNGPVFKSAWGLTVKETYFVGPGTGLVLGAALPSTPGTIIHEIGYAKTSETFIVTLDRDWTIL